MDNVGQPFHLDFIAEQIADYTQKRRQMRELKKWCDDFEHSLVKLADGRSEWLLHGKPFATRRTNGKFTLSRLAAEQPHIVEQYTRYVTELKFDEDAFRAENPTLFEQYRAARLVVNKDV